ncbi:MAG: hypothetical protein FJ319_10480 [SAR202 cluster bacterium]|nr:hypothetical protein [SAR202 cluster bacterium]
MGVSLLKPVDIEVSFDSRAYSLGEHIDVKCKVYAKIDCHVREARLELVVEERWVERYGVTSTDHVMQHVPGMYGEGYVAETGAFPKTRMQVDEHVTSTLNNSVAFIWDKSLERGKTYVFSVRVPIDPHEPPHAGRAEMKWGLKVRVDIAGAKDLTELHEVSVLV